MRAELYDAFLEDHQHLMLGLAAIVDHLRSGDVGAATEAAVALDERVGCHVEFEERSLYPALAPVLGGGHIEQLYDEHASGQSAIRDLLSHGAAGLTAARRDELAARLAATLEHAVSCGTLLTHLDSLDDARCKQLLSELRALREKATRWTDLPTRRPRPGLH